jgi:hypothetical protein
MRPTDMLQYERKSSILAAICLLDAQRASTSGIRAWDVVYETGWSYPTIRRGRDALVDIGIPIEFDRPAMEYRIDAKYDRNLTLGAMVEQRLISYGEAVLLSHPYKK